LGETKRPDLIDVISSIVHGRSCVGDVTHAIGWTATERRYVERGG
jgi:hypothetical protein